jgi:hypothetical protein
MIVGRPANDEASIAVDVPQFVSEMIEVELSSESRRLLHSGRFDTLKPTQLRDSGAL